MLTKNWSEAGSKTVHRVRPATGIEAVIATRSTSTIESVWDAGSSGFAHVRGEERLTGWVKGKAVRSTPDCDLDEGAGIGRVEDADGVLTAVRGEDSVRALGHERASDPARPRSNRRSEGR